MKKLAASLLALAMAASLCACRDMLYNEEKSPVPKLDLTVGYSFADETLSDPDSGKEYYSQSLGTASISSAAVEKAAAAINESLEALYAQLRDEADYTKRVAADQTQPDIVTLSYSCTPRATRCDTRVLSLVFDVVQNTGGVHGNFVRHSRSYDSDTGSELSLDDIAKNAQQLRTFVENYVMGLAAGEEYRENGESFLFPDFQDTIKGIVADGQKWYFDEKGLVLYADPYDIAPYSYGVLCFTVPYSALEEFIDPDFMPAGYDGENGMVLAEAGDGFDRNSVNMVGTVTVDEGAQSIILSAEETVYNLKLYSSERMLWQRNYLTDGEAAELICYIPDAIPNIVIEYRLADGSVITRGVFQSGEDGSILLVEMSEEELSAYSSQLPR